MLYETVKLLKDAEQFNTSLWRAWIILYSSTVLVCKEYLMCLAYDNVAQGKEERT